MIADEAKEWIESLIGTLRSDLSNQVREVSDALHKRLDVVHDKHNTTLSALSHLIQKVHDMAVDHASILAELKTFDADLETRVDAAVSEFQSFESTHAAAQESLSDIGDIVAGLPAKLAKLDAIKEPTDASTSSGSASSGSDSVSGASGSAPVTATTTAPSGASVQTTVDQAAGQTTAVSTDPTTGATSTTVVSHSDGSATTTDASGTTVATDTEAAQAATQAAADAGVTVGGSSV